MADRITLKLAHPLSATQAERLRARDVKEYKVGDTISLDAAGARSLIDAGFATGVEPSNTEAVRDALGSAADASATAVSDTKSTTSKK